MTDSKISVKRIFDERAIRKFMSDPQLFDAMMDDLPVKPDDLQPNTAADTVRWLGIYHNEKLVGMWYLSRLNHIMWQLHVAYAPDSWGTGIPKASIEQALDLAFKTTGAKKLYANIPTSYKQVVNFAKFGGMKIEGTCKRSWQKNGQIYDTYHMGVYR